LLGTNYHLLRSFLEVAPPPLSDALSQGRALRAARVAAARVPAYRDFLQERGVNPFRIASMEELPETNKRNYIDAYPLVQRCVRGRIPLVGTTIDESSGSTGTPYNWVTSNVERKHVRRMISFFARYTFGEAPLVILNAFSMGAWATGLTTAVARHQDWGVWKVAAGDNFALAVRPDGLPRGSNLRRGDELWLANGWRSECLRRQPC